MNESNEHHFLRLHAYLSRNVSGGPGINVIKAGILSHCRKDFLTSKINSEEICPSCYCPWSEGNFSMKFGSKKMKKKKGIKHTVWKMKCLNCDKNLINVYDVNLAESHPPNIEKAKPKPTDLKKSHFPKIQKDSKNLLQSKKRGIQPSKNKKKPSNSSHQKKSNLTFLNDFL